MTTFRHYRKIEIVASLVMWVITIGMGVYLAAMWSRIPDIVPTHYGLFGQPDGRENENFGTVSCPSGRDAHRPGGASSGGKVYDQDRITGDDKSELYCPHRTCDRGYFRMDYRRYNRVWKAGKIFYCSSLCVGGGFDGGDCNQPEA